MKYIVLLICFLFLNVKPVLAQNYKEDPLNKPKIWQKLVKSPSDFTIWNEYIGKEWGEMSKEEKEEVIVWRKHLLEKKTLGIEKTSTQNNQPQGVSQKDIVEIKKIEEEVIRVEHITTQELNALKTIILEEEEEVASLKGNVAANFIMIEDLYLDIFKELGASYRPYIELHPKGDYPKTKWIEEQEQKIKRMKLKRYEALRGRIQVKD